MEVAEKYENSRLHRNVANDAITSVNFVDPSHRQCQQAHSENIYQHIKM